MFLSTIFVWIPILISTPINAAEFQTHYCEHNTSRYINRSTSFYSNLVQVLDSLASDTNVNENRFSNRCLGSFKPEIACGLYLCRADKLPNDCRNCLLKAREDINNTCPSSTAAVAWNNNCMIRYANYSIVSVMNSATYIFECNKLNTSEQASEQKQFWEVAIKFVRTLAYRGSSQKKELFAYDELPYNDTEKVYGYVECTPDLSASDCNECLVASIDRLGKYCYGRQGARVLAASCNVRFEIYEFLQFPTAAASSHGRKKNLSKIIAAYVAAIVGFLVITGVICYLLIVKKKKRLRLIASSELREATSLETDESEMIREQSLQFELSTIEEATNNFSNDNKIGEGGFGVGILANGDVIAVKRLSKGSGQGLAEFKNEVVLLAKLQHRNLVRLLGFCIHSEEKILIYEYVANHSLDFFLFDGAKTMELEWSTRCKIIGGIARGMLYLHEDSRLRIIHRDLKTSNILLHEEMNPKISDFGMARIVCGSQIHTTTNRIVGTFGYMSPEYSMHGHFSVKSDVFSFGVLVLEIITGKKNTRFFQSGYTDLPCYVWSKWKSGQPLEILDSNLAGFVSDNEAIYCINVALLCVQEDDELRPSMHAIVLMLNSYSVALPVPQKPPFVSRKRPAYVTSDKMESASSTYTVWHTDASLITDVHPR